MIKMVSDKLGTSKPSQINPILNVVMLLTGLKRIYCDLGICVSRYMCVTETHFLYQGHSGTGNTDTSLWHYVYIMTALKPPHFFYLRTSQLTHFSLLKLKLWLILLTRGSWERILEFSGLPYILITLKHIIQLLATCFMYSFFFFWVWLRILNLHSIFHQLIQYIVIYN